MRTGVSALAPGSDPRVIHGLDWTGLHWTGRRVESASHAGPDGSEVAISFYLPNSTAVQTYHPFSFQTNYVANGDVKGAEAHPLFRWLAAQGGYWSRPRWNFYKYLITPDGHLKTWFSSLTSPKSACAG